MRLKLEFGPVFKFECLAASRRWQYFAGRVVFIALLLAALFIVISNVERNARGPVRFQDIANAGEKFYLAIIITQLSLLFLAAPAIGADAICLDKSRGALVPLMTTDLSSAEIILGKFCVRLLPILAFVFCGLPVMAICFSMGGIHPEVVFGAFLVSLGVALAGGAGALLLSVWCNKTYEVLLVCYLVWIVWLLLLPMTWALPGGFPTAWARFSNPIYLCVAPYLDPGSVGIPDFWYFFAGCLGLAVLFISFAIGSLRRVAVRHGEVVAKRRQRSWRVRLPWLPGPTLDGNPVLWREWQRRQPSRWVRVVWWLYTLIAGGFTLYVFVQILLALPNVLRGEFGILVNAFQVSVGLLLISVVSVTSFQDERVRGSLDVLMTTPLSSVQIYWGKWWGNFRLVLLLSLLPTVLDGAPFLRHCLDTSSWLSPLATSRTRYFLLIPLLVCCYGAGVVTLGLAFAIWIKSSGRAITASVTAYLAMTVGLLLRPLLHLSSDEFSTMGSSFMATGWLTVASTDRGGGRLQPIIPALMIWCVIYCVATALIALVSCRSFDRCLGRLPEHMPRSGPKVHRQQGMEVATISTPLPASARGTHNL